MREQNASTVADSDPSFIRKNASELFDWARRVGLSADQVRDAVDSGLIKPASGPQGTRAAGDADVAALEVTAVSAPVISTEMAPREGPDSAA